MSQLNREDLRALRWELLATMPTNRVEECQIHRMLKRVNTEISVRNKNLNNGR